MERLQPGPGRGSGSAEPVPLPLPGLPPRSSARFCEAEARSGERDGANPGLGGEEEEEEEGFGTGRRKRKIPVHTARRVHQPPASASLSLSLLSQKGNAVLFLQNQKMNHQEVGKLSNQTINRGNATNSRGPCALGREGSEGRRAAPRSPAQGNAHRGQCSDPQHALVAVFLPC